MEENPVGLDKLQRIAMSLMAVLVLITFVGANLQAIFWQTSDWLVSTVLPSVVINLTNEERLDNNQAQLVRNPVLDKAAQLKAEDMAKNEYFSHFSPTGASPWHWFDQAGYVYAHAGENLAIHFTDSSEVVEAWMKSPTHRANIVNGKYTEIGVGTAKGRFDGYKTVYVVQLFGTPAAVPTKVETPALAVSEPAPALPEVVEAPQFEAVPTDVLAMETTETETIPTEPVLVTPTEETQSVPETPEVAEEKPIETNNFVTEDLTIKSNEEVLIIESPVIATSSGLAIADITVPIEATEDSVLAIATQPNNLLQIIYFTLGSVVFLLLIISVITEARKLHYAQVAYGLVLILGMSGLWYVHSLLTGGAVIA